MSKATVAGKARRSAHRNDDEADEAVEIDRGDGQRSDDDLDASAKADTEPADEDGGVDPDAGTETSGPEKDEKQDDGRPRVMEVGRIRAVAVVFAALAVVLLLSVLGVSNYHHQNSEAAGDAARTEVTRHTSRGCCLIPRAR
jgi:hypothetical protein